MTVLSAWTGNVWMRLFGDNLLSMRILSGLCYLLSTAITTGYFWRVCRNWRWTLLLAIVMIFTFRVHGIRFYGWDAGTIPFTAALSVTAFSCVSSPKIWKIIIGGVLCALVGLGRMPSLALALPMLLLVVAAGWGKSPGKAMAAGALGLSVCVAAGLLLIVAFYGSVGAYVHYFETSGVISGHGTEMWSRILWHELWHDITLFFHNNIAGDLCLGVSLMLIARYSKYALCITLLTVVYHTPYSCIDSSAGSQICGIYPQILYMGGYGRLPSCAQIYISQGDAFEYHPAGNRGRMLFHSRSGV